MIPTAQLLRRIVNPTKETADVCRAVAIRVIADVAQAIADAREAGEAAACEP